MMPALRLVACFKARPCFGHIQKLSASTSTSEPASLPNNSRGTIQHQENDTFNVYNPANGDLVASLPNMDGLETKDAIQRAHTAFSSWRRTTAKHRSDLLKEACRLVRSRKDDLANLISLENGKPFTEAVQEVLTGASYIEWFAEECRRIQGNIIASPDVTKRLLVTKQPSGVCGMITPWNFPHTMVVRKACCALAAGCTVVLKPSEETPLSALAVKDVLVDAGFPDHVMDVLTCDKPRASDVGRAMCESPLISHISFTGSTSVGKILLRQSASTVKRCTMELGGNAPFIVFPSADLEAAVAGTMLAKFRNYGQTCICPNRFFVHESVHDDFLQKLIAAMDKEFGQKTTRSSRRPLINCQAVDKISSLMTDAINQGAVAVYGDVSCHHGDGLWSPMVLTNVTNEMRCYNEEIFGPVVTITKFSTEKEVVTMANSTQYGLAGYVYSRDFSQLMRLSEILECGMLGLNEGHISFPEAPHGGFKESGLGREGGICIGIEQFLDTKYVCIGGL